MESNNNKDNQSLSPIGLMEMRAMELRFEGYIYQAISDKLGLEFGFERAPKAQTIATWFMRGGKLNAFYRAYVKEQTEIRKEEAQNLFRAHLSNAVKCVLALLGDSDSDMVKLLSAKEIINRQLGEPVKKIQTETVNPARDILEGAGLLKDGQSTDTKAD